MREDMSRKLVERGRERTRGGPCKDDFRLRRRRELNQTDDPPKNEGIRQVTIERQRAFGENYAPLLRFLNKSVGRPWHKVEQEIRADLRGSPVRIYHAWFHIDMFVTRSPAATNVSSRFFVDEHGLLRRKRETPKREEPKTDRVTFSATEWYEGREKVWYHVWADGNGVPVKRLRVSKKEIRREGLTCPKRW